MSNEPETTEKKYIEREIRWHNNMFKFTFFYTKEIVADIKQIPGRTYEAEPEKAWFAPNAMSSISRIRWVANKHQFTFSPEAAEKFFETSLQELNIERQHTTIPELPKLPFPLRPFQEFGVRRILRDKRMILADDMGLGKTIQALAAMEAAKAYPAIVLCPKTAKGKWYEECQKWLPHRSAMILGSEEEKVYNADIIIVNYDILVRKHLKELTDLQPEFVVIDEGGKYCRNHAALRTKATKQLAQWASYRLDLTGTPIEHHVKDLIPQLDIIGQLDNMGGFWHVAKRYAEAKKTAFGWDMNGAANLGELHDRLQSVCFLRRRKVDVAKEIPGKTIDLIPFQIDNMSEYIAAEAEIADWLEALKKDKKLSKTGKEQIARYETLKQISARGKLPYVIEWAELFQDMDGEKLVLFADHIEIQKALLDAFPDAAHIFGKDSDKVRKANNDRFQKDPDCKYIICSLRSANTAIDLTAASNVGFVEFAWTPTDMEQAEDRLNRMTQKFPVTCYYFIGEHTIDEEIAGILGHKGKIIEQAIEGKQISQSEICSQLTQALLSRYQHPSRKKRLAA